MNALKKVLENSFLSSIRSLEIKPLTGGLTNKTHLILAGNTPKYIVRTFSESSKNFIDRQREWKFLNFFSTHHGIAPKPLELAEDGSYSITEFIPGDILEPKDLANPQIFLELSCVFKKMHQTPVEMLEDSFDSYSETARLLRLIKNQGIPHHEETENLFEKISIIHEKLNDTETILVPCHLDLIHANIIVNTKGSKRDYRLIDWEYAACAPLELEFANFFSYLTLSETTEQELLGLYFHKASSKKIRAFYERIKLTQITGDFYWYLWALLREVDLENPLTDSSLKNLYWSRSKNKLDLFQENYV